MKTAGFLRDRSANVIVTFALALSALAAATGAAIDYGRISGTRSQLQAAADAAALAAVRELRLAGRQDAVVKALALEIAAAELGDRDFDFAATINADRDRLTVELARHVDTLVYPRSGPQDVRVRAEALVQGGAPVCMLSLASSGGGAVKVEAASVLANGCAVYSNSADPSGIKIAKHGRVEADLVCSGGGVSASGGRVKPAPTLDCPAVADPIGGRPAPPVGACDHEDSEIFGVAILRPGTYCGGLRLRKGTVATFLPGAYVIKDGPLVFEDLTVVNGLGVGFYLTGPGAVFDVKAKTSVRLTAPVKGPLAGMLFFEDRANRPARHRIESRDAPVLLGTIYLPVSTLEVGNPEGLALLEDVLGALSAWTIVVAQKVRVGDGLKLTLNSDYGATSVPVPVGFGEGASVTLTR